MTYYQASEESIKELEAYLASEEGIRKVAENHKRFEEERKNPKIVG